VAQDDYYYEIQLTNKQLVFYFMAGATGLILSFLAGVMVGKGVDASAGDVQAARPPIEDRVVAEEPAARPTPPPADELTYAGRLEADKPEEARLEATKPARAAATPAPKPVKPTPAPKAAASAPTRMADASAPPPTLAKPVAPPASEAKPAPAAAKSPAAKTPPTTTAAATKGGPSSFTIQVGAFKDRATADSVVSRLKAKGFAAYLIAPESEGVGLYNVRVGSYPARADAERIQTKLREEKFKPFIVKN
jgi:cell division protein FtsN